MKKLFTILAILMAFISNAQPGYTPISTTKYNWTLPSRFSGGLHIPASCGYPVSLATQWVGDGAICVDTCNSKVYYRIDGVWKALADTSAVPTNVWRTDGNSGISSATNFLGTTDNVDLRFRVNNIRAGRITPLGSTYLDSSNAAGIYIGNYAGFNDTNTIRNSIAIGTNALRDYPGTEPGSGQLAIGHEALRHLIGGVTTGSNIAIGTRSLFWLTTGYRNTAVGLNSGHNLATGTHNTLYGAFAGERLFTGSFNDAFGQGALRNGGDQVNTALGTNALYYNTWSVLEVTDIVSSSDWTTATPVFTLPNTSPFGFSTEVTPTGIAIISGGQIVGVTVTEPGIGAGPGTTISFIGDGTSATATVVVGGGSYNVGVGADALFVNRFGYGNTALGYRAGYVTGRYRDSSNLFAGRMATISGSATSNPIKYLTVIGADAVGLRSNSVILGRTSDSVGIGTIDPQDRLHVTGRVRFDNALYFPGTTTSGSGYVGPFGSALLAMPNLDANGFLPAVYLRNASAGSNAAIAIQMNNNLNSYALWEMEGSNRTSFNPDGMLLATNGSGGIKLLPGTVFKIGFGVGTINHTRVYEDSMFSGLRTSTTSDDTSRVVYYNPISQEFTYHTPPLTGSGSQGLEDVINIDNVLTTPQDIIANATFQIVGGNDVNISSNTLLNLISGNAEHRFRGDSIDYVSGNTTGHRFYTGSNQRMTILSNGNVGIGHANPTEKFVVDGNIVADAPVYSSGGYNVLVWNTTSKRFESYETSLSSNIIVNGGTGDTTVRFSGDSIIHKSIDLLDGVGFYVTKNIGPNDIKYTGNVDTTILATRARTIKIADSLIALSGGGSTTIYNGDGTLGASRTVSGNSSTRGITWSAVDHFNVTRAGNNRILLNSTGTHIYSQDGTKYWSASDAGLLGQYGSQLFRMAGDTAGFDRRVSYNSNINGSLTVNSLTTVGRQDSLLSLSLNRSNDIQNVLESLGSDIKAQTAGLNMTITANGAQGLVDGREVFVPVWLDKPNTITGVRVSIVAAHTGATGDNENRVGLYTYSGGTMTLVASSANNSTLWTAPSANSTLSVDFSTPYAAQPGLYYVGLLYNQSAGTPPTIAGWTDAGNAVRVTGFGNFTNSAKLHCYVATSTLASSQTHSGATTNIDIHWVALY